MSEFVTKEEKLLPDNAAKVKFRDVGVPPGLCGQHRGDPFAHHLEDVIEGRTFEERDDLVDLFCDCSVKVFTGRLSKYPQRSNKTFIYLISLKQNLKCLWPLKTKHRNMLSFESTEAGVHSARNQSADCIIAADSCPEGKHVASDCWIPQVHVVNQILRSCQCSRPRQSEMVRWVRGILLRATRLQSTLT